jgi:hypothetical protein
MQELVSKISQRVISLKHLLPVNESTLSPTKGGNGGDDCLWLGLLSSVGLPSALISIIECQGFNGMFYRNPSRVGVNKKPYFSRDMALGVLCAYTFMENNDILKFGSQKWIEYIELTKTDANIVKSVFKVIKNYSKLKGGNHGISLSKYRFAPDEDGRSDINPVMWSLMSEVWRKNGWETTKQMDRCANVSNWWVPIESKFTDPGYKTHLKAVQAYIKLKIGNNIGSAHKIANECYKKCPDNMFFDLLANGVSINLLEKFIKLCPSADNFKSKDYWLWEKSDVSLAIKNGQYCGWDWYFLGMLIHILCYRSNDEQR